MVLSNACVMATRSSAAGRSWAIPRSTRGRRGTAAGAVRASSYGISLADIKDFRALYRKG